VLVAWVRPRARNLLQGVGGWVVGCLGGSPRWHTRGLPSDRSSSRCQVVFVWMCLLCPEPRGTDEGPPAKETHPPQQCCIYYAIIKWQLCKGVGWISHCVSKCVCLGPVLRLTVIYADDWQLGRSRWRLRRSGPSQDEMPFNWGMCRDRALKTIAVTLVIVNLIFNNNYLNKLCKYIS